MGTKLRNEVLTTGYLSKQKLKKSSITLTSTVSVVIIYVQAGNTVTTTVENGNNAKSQHDAPRFTTGVHLHINWLPTTIIHHTNKHHWRYQLLYPFRVALLHLFSFMSILPYSSFNTFIYFHFPSLCLSCWAQENKVIYNEVQCTQLESQGSHLQYSLRQIKTTAECGIFHLCGW
jgi:hypothetical protein